MPLLYFTHPSFVEHVNGPGHPERPERLHAIEAGVSAAVANGVEIERRAPRAATPEELRRVHTAAHVEEMLAWRGRSGWIDSDTGVCPHSVDAACRAAGAVVEAVDAVLDGGAASCRALAGVRPPGHHAEPDRAMGFCLFNNIAVGAAHALAREGVGSACARVLIVDWDVHHGNGTQSAFWSRDDVLFVSSHRAPFYPGTGAERERGEGPGAGLTVNWTFPAGTGDEDVLTRYREELPGLVRAFSPDLVMVSAGFDGHRDDPLGGWEMTDEGFDALCALVRDLADTHAGGRLVLVTEGGYDLGALGRCVQGCVETLRDG